MDDERLKNLGGGNYWKESCKRSCTMLLMGILRQKLPIWRADADQPFMGLTTFEGELPAIKDIKIAKNYL